MKPLIDLEKAYVDPLLQDFGFIKQDHQYIKDIESLVYLINLQKSRHSDRSRVDLTLNVGICAKEVWSLYWNRPFPDDIDETDCFPRFRIGSILADFSPKARDLWWTIHGQSDIEKTGREIRDLIDTSCLPFFARFNSISDIKTFCDSYINIKNLLPLERFFYAIMAFIVGDFTMFETMMTPFDNDKEQALRLKANEIRHRLRTLLGGRT